MKRLQTLFDHRDEQRLLVLKVAVQARAGDPRRGGNHADRHRVVRVMQEQIGGGIEEQFPSRTTGLRCTLPRDRGLCTRSFCRHHRHECPPYLGPIDIYRNGRHGVGSHRRACRYDTREIINIYTGCTTHPRPDFNGR
ncbi:uncharacterized protein RMCC_5235 [Mycolicibacterium canariasense]|uniref:Uncharacterized protein n=1 Tax=Mycolicibacterium canariasense TaxID=228230 RepID=A0A124E2Y4_MYCCR|nr:uncharacterized protein RMCC_5235 [Mycolicibacterium canariasense]